MTAARSTGAVDGRAEENRRGHLLTAQAVRLVGRMTWRYRSELAPVGAALALLAVATAAHALAPRWWWVALPAGMAVTLAAWRWAVDRAEERLYVEVVGAVATLWLAIACRVGPVAPLRWLLLAGALPSAVPWWWHRRRRSKATAQRMVDRWEGIAADAGIPGCRVQRLTSTSSGWEARLRLRRGQTYRDVVARLEPLASALGARPDSVRVERDPRRADRCQLRVLREDPLREVLSWPGPSAFALRNPMTLGRWEDGRPVRLCLDQVALLIAGAKGSGKSVMVNTVCAELVAMPGVLVWGIDLKGGQELSPWRPALQFLATDVPSAIEMLRAARRLVDVRGAINADRGRKHWPCSIEEPAIVLVIDEFGQLDAEGLKLATQLGQLGRSVAIQLVLATQNPSAKSMGNDTTLRGQLDARICLQVIEPGHTNVILGDGAITEGWLPHKLDASGKFLLRCEKQRHSAPRWARGYLMTDAMVDEVVTRYGCEQPPLDGASAAAIAGLALTPRGCDGRLGADAGAASNIVLLPSDRDDDGEDVLRAALRTATSDGVTYRDLLRVTGLSTSGLTKRLGQLRAAGLAEQASHGRWRATATRKGLGS